MAKKTKRMLGSAGSVIVTWYFSTDDPEIFIAVDYNSDTGRYDLNPRTVPREKVPQQFLKYTANRMAGSLGGRAPSSSKKRKKMAKRKMGAPSSGRVPSFFKKPMKKKKSAVGPARKRMKKKAAPKRKPEAKKSSSVRKGTASSPGSGRLTIHGVRQMGFIRAAKPGFRPEANLAVSAVGKAVFNLPPDAPSLVPATERQINIWVADGGAELKRVLKIGETYLLNFRVGQPVTGSLTTGEAAAVEPGDVPPGGLLTDWLVVGRGAALEAGTTDTTVSVATVGGVSIWAGRFEILIPEAGDSATLQLKVKALHGDPLIDVVVTTQKGELYRQFKIELAVAKEPGVRRAEPASIADELMPTTTAHIGLRTTHEWTTPDSVLNVVVLGSQATVMGRAGAEQINSIEPWLGVLAKVSGRIKNLRDAAEETRTAWESHFNAIDPADLAERLKRWQPEYSWTALGDYADAAHRTQWEKMAVSAEFRKFARQGRQLFQAFFPRDSNLAKWMAALSPGARLNISWTPHAGAGFIPHVPWGLMYVVDLPEGQPVDPMGFLGMRCRIAYTSHAASPASRSLGALDATHRAHFLYWGDGATDVTGQEARWQRNQWSAWENQVFVPTTTSNAKVELLKLMNDPQPSPTSILYLFCQCNLGAGNDPTLRFGSTNDPENVVTQTDFGTSPLADRPLVFANACTTIAADPFMANELEEVFFDRDCRAYIGTETKVPIVFGSRFAEIFFRFFYRLVDPAPMAAGEALTQARLFLWTHYRNIGGLFYAYVNQYDLFHAHDDEVVALRG